MAKYIDINLLKKEIDRLGEIEYPYSYDQCVGFYDALDRMESFVNSLQQKQMLKDTVEEVKARCLKSYNPVSKSPDESPHIVTLLYEENENTPYVVGGDRVKIIIVKEK